jgi:ComEC/Rec2-related protein
MPELNVGHAVLMPPEAAQITDLPAATGRNARAIMTRAPLTQSTSGFLSRASRRLDRQAAAARQAFGTEFDHGRFFLASPIFLGAGAITWFRLAVDVPPMRFLAWAILFGLIFVLAGAARVAARRVAMSGLLVILGMFAAQLETWRTATVVLDTPVTTTVTGRVERREGDDNGRWRYIVRVTRTDEPSLKRPPQQVSLVARAGEPVAVGGWLTGRVRLTPPAGPALPDLNDFAFSAYFDGIGANGFFYGIPQPVPSQAAVVDLSAGNRAMEWLYGLRSRVGDRIRSILPGDTGAFAASLVTDERRAISNETTEALRQSGLAHIVAISGLNMALSAGICFVGLRLFFGLFPGFAQAYPTKKFAAGSALLALTAYYMISGFAVSAERAFIMMAIMLVAALFDRPSISLRNIALSAVLIILMSPSEVLGPSFQMSYAATLALVAGFAVWTKRRHRGSVFLSHPAIKPVMVTLRFFGGIALTSMIGGFSTALFSIEHFHRLSAYGLPANLLAMPVISFIVMPFGMLAMLATPLGLDALPWTVAGFGLDLVIDIAKMVSGWGGSVDIGRIPEWYFATAVLGFLVWGLMHTRLRWLGALGAAIATLVVVMLPAAPAPELVVSEDGSLVASVRSDGLASNRERPPDFIFGQWQRALAIANHKPPDMLDGQPLSVPKRGEPRPRLTLKQQREVRAMMRQAAALTNDSGFQCLKTAWCVTALDSGYVIATLENAAYLGPACDVADIVITPVRLRQATCRSGAMLLTGETLRRSGAVEIRIDEQGAPVVKTAYESLGRPWMRHRAYDWRNDSFSDDPSPLSDIGE